MAAAKAVIAGNYAEYLNYCRKTGINPNDKDVAFYVFSPESLTGKTNFVIVLWGTYYTRDLPIDYLYARAEMSRIVE